MVTLVAGAILLTLLLAVTVIAVAIIIWLGHAAHSHGDQVARGGGGKVGFGITRGWHNHIVTSSLGWECGEWWEW